MAKDIATNQITPLSLLWEMGGGRGCPIPADVGYRIIDRNWRLRAKERDKTVMAWTYGDNKGFS